MLQSTVCLGCCICAGLAHTVSESSTDAESIQMPTCLVTRKLRIGVVAPVIVAAPTAAEPLCKLTVEAGLHVLCREEGGREGAGDSQQASVLGPCLVCCACMQGTDVALVSSVPRVTPHPLSAAKHPRCRQGVARDFKWCERPVIEAETIASLICFVSQPQRCSRPTPSKQAKQRRY